MWKVAHTELDGGDEAKTLSQRLDSLRVDNFGTAHSSPETRWSTTDREHARGIERD